MAKEKIEVKQFGDFGIRVDNLEHQGIRNKADFAKKYADPKFNIDVDEIWDELKQFVKKDK